MSGFTWKPDISVGNLITIATMLFMVGVGWSAMNGRVDSQQRRLDELAARVEQDADESAKERLRVTELLTEMRADIRYLRERANAQQSNSPRQ